MNTERQDAAGGSIKSAIQAWRDARKSGDKDRVEEAALKVAVALAKSDDFATHGSSHFEEGEYAALRDDMDRLAHRIAAGMTSNT